MKIVAFDLSLTGTGYATGGDHGVLRPPKAAGKGMERLYFIVNEVRRLAEDASIAVIEGYSYGSQGRAVVSMGELGGVVRLALWAQGVPVVEVAPGTLKKYATGSGNAKKPDMLMAAVKRLGVEETDDNIIDALWLRQMALDHYGLPDAVQMPKANRESLEVVEWPALNGRNH